MQLTRAIRLVMILGVLVGTAGCDQVTKHLARTELREVGALVGPGRLIEFRLAENPGAFLSLGASLPDGVRGGFAVCLSVGLLCLLAYLVRAERLRLIAFLGLALIWAGGMSNLIDRFARHGLVTDFVILRIGPIHTGIFNLADLAIVAGVVMVVLGKVGRPEGEMEKLEGETVKMKVRN